MNNKKNEQRIDLIARSLARNLRLNSRAAKARRIRTLWHDALLRGEPVEVPGLELRIVWGQQKQQLQPVPTGLLKSNRKTPIRLVKPGNSVKVSYRSTVYFEFDDQGNVAQVVKPQDRSRRVKWIPGVSMPDQKPSPKDKLSRNRHQRRQRHMALPTLSLRAPCRTWRAPSLYGCTSSRSSAVAPRCSDRTREADDEQKRSCQRLEGA